MFFIMLSVLTLILVSFSKIALSKVLSPESYAHLNGVMGMAALAGTIFFGCYPKIFPSKVKLTKTILIDLFSLMSLLIMILIVAVTYNATYMFVFLLFIAFYSIHESLSICYSLNPNGKKLFFIELCNLFIFLALLIAVEFFGFSFTFVLIPLFLSIIILFLFYYKDGYKFKIELSLRSLYSNAKYIVLSSSIGVFLVPFFLSIFFPPIKASLMIAYLLIFSIPVAFNQLVINRVFYRINLSCVTSLLVISFIALIETLLYFGLNNIGWLDIIKNYLTKYKADVGAASVLFILISRAFFSYIFIKARFHNISINISITIELLKFLLILFGIIALSEADVIESHFSYLLNLISISYIIATLLYSAAIYFGARSCK